MTGTFTPILKAAADFLGNGAIEVPAYESEITDIVRRNSVAMERFKKPKATGHPHRYFEQLAIAQGAFTDPRNVQPTPTSPNRVERSAMIKAVTAQSNFGLFDVEVTQQQGQFASVEAQDVEDVISGVVLTEASAIWYGNDTSLSAPTSLQFVGLLNQITQQSTIAPGASIVDGLKAEVAQMVGNIGFNVRPTAIYLHPILGDYLDQEEKARQLVFDKVEVTAGVWVKAIMTQAGLLPIVTDPFLVPFSGAGYGFSAPPAAAAGAPANRTYPAVILTESMVEMPYVSGNMDNPKPRLFQLGLLSGLQKQWVAIHFAAILAKGASYAHAVVGVQRP